MNCVLMSPAVLLLRGNVASSQLALLLSCIIQRYTLKADFSNSLPLVCGQDFLARQLSS